MKRIGFIKGNRVDFKDGFIVVPPFATAISLAEPDVFVQSLLPLYPIGTLAWFPGMGKKFRYSKAGTALVGIKNLVVNGNRPPTATAYEDVNGFYDPTTGANSVCAVGATEITFTDTVDKGQDYYAGAYMLHFDALRNVCFEDSYIISGPPAAITTPWSCTVKLLKPKKYGIILGDGIEIWLNPYSNIQKHDAEVDGEKRRYQTHMGVPPIPVTSGYYFWLQTAGPVFIIPNSWAELCPGYEADKRMAWVHQHGAIITATGAVGVGDQPIGVLLSKTLAGSADAWVNMDLDLGH